jgi:hypothetical protein
VKRRHLTLPEKLYGLFGVADTDVRIAEDKRQSAADRFDSAQTLPKEDFPASQQRYSNARGRAAVKDGRETQFAQPVKTRHFLNGALFIWGRRIARGDRRT